MPSVAWGLVRRELGFRRCGHIRAEGVLAQGLLPRDAALHRCRKGRVAV